MFPGIKLDRREGGDKRRRVVESSGSDQLEALERRLHKTPEFVGHKPTWESTAREKKARILISVAERVQCML